MNIYNNWVMMEKRVMKQTMNAKVKTISEIRYPSGVLKIFYYGDEI